MQFDVWSNHRNLLFFHVETAIMELTYGGSYDNHDGSGSVSSIR